MVRAAAHMLLPSASEPAGIRKETWKKTLARAEALTANKCVFWVLDEISSHLNVFLAVSFTQWLVFRRAALRIPEGGSNEYCDEAEDKSSMSSHLFANASLFSVQTV